MPAGDEFEVRTVGSADHGSLGSRAEGNEGVVGQAGDLRPEGRVTVPDPGEKVARLLPDAMRWRQDSIHPLERPEKAPRFSDARFRSTRRPEVPR